MDCIKSRAQLGRTAYLAGAAAEEMVSRNYQRRGYQLIANRWRGKSGEIDLIFRMGAECVFVEVKKSKTFAAAAQRVSNKQKWRIFAAAQEFLGSEPLGQLTESRFDVALVDVFGKIDILENALATD